MNIQQHTVNHAMIIDCKTSERVGKIAVELLRRFCTGWRST